MNSGVILGGAQRVIWGSLAGFVLLSFVAAPVAQSVYRSWHTPSISTTTDYALEHSRIVGAVSSLVLCSIGLGLRAKPAALVRIAAIMVTPPHLKLMEPRARRIVECSMLAATFVVALAPWLYGQLIFAPLFYWSAGWERDFCSEYPLLVGGFVAALGVAYLVMRDRLTSVTLVAAIISNVSFGLLVWRVSQYFINN